MHMMERKMRMITMMLLVWTALYLMVVRAHSQPEPINGRNHGDFGARQVSQVGGRL
jgi:hypothetical protein